MIALARKIHRRSVKYRYVLTHFGEVARLANDRRAAEAYRPGERYKSAIRIWAELMRWLVKYGEVNTYYYAFGFHTKPAIEQSDFLSIEEFKRIRNDLNTVAWIGRYWTKYGCLLKDKFVFHLLASSLGFPTPKILGVALGETIYWLDSRSSAGVDSVAAKASLDAFGKTILGECAEGTFPLRSDGGRVFLDGAELPPAELAERLRHGFIIEERITQHPAMAELYPDSVNSLRLITVRKGEDVILFAAEQKIGANGQTRDNWATGGLLGLVDPVTGKLGREFIYRPDIGGKATRHPQTGVTFEGREVPFFKEAVNMAREFHSFLYGTHSIGWDIAITSEGPMFIEGNDNWEMTACQSLEGGLKKRFLDTIVPRGEATA
jgi:hypothetical protein